MTEDDIGLDEHEWEIAATMSRWQTELIILYRLRRDIRACKRDAKELEKQALELEHDLGPTAVQALNEMENVWTLQGTL